MATHTLLIYGGGQTALEVATKTIQRCGGSIIGLQPAAQTLPPKETNLRFLVAVLALYGLSFQERACTVKEFMTRIKLAEGSARDLLRTLHKHGFVIFEKAQRMGETFTITDEGRRRGNEWFTFALKGRRLIFREPQQTDDLAQSLPHVVGAILADRTHPVPVPYKQESLILVTAWMFHRIGLLTSVFHMAGHLGCDAQTVNAALTTLQKQGLLQPGRMKSTYMLTAKGEEWGQSHFLTLLS